MRGGGDKKRKIFSHKKHFATISEFDTRIYKDRYDTWGMTAGISQKSLNHSESGDSEKRTEREIDNPEIDNQEIDNLLLSAPQDLNI